MNRLAIIDWGIGGISIYKLVKEQLGDIPVIYFSDTGVTPYGKMTRAELVSRLNAVILYLKPRGVTHLVIGCNAASTAAPYLNAQDIRIEGVINSAIAQTIEQKPKSLGLIGGRRTVLSGVYRRAFPAHGIKVKQRIAQPLSGLIESGDVSSPKLIAECKRILRPLKNCTHILLACTHYPAIASILKDQVSNNTVFIDPASNLVKKIALWRLEPESDDIFLTSGNSDSMKRAAIAAFSVDLHGIKRVSI